MNNPLEVHPTLSVSIQSFLLDRRASGRAAKTIAFYSEYLNQFAQFCAGMGANSVQAVTVDTLRAFILDSSSRHNPGGVHAGYRSVRAFLRWYESEFEPTGWTNPVRKVKCPKVALAPLEPVLLEDVSAMLATINTSKKLDVRDKAVLLTLLDTGVRANELLSLQVEDVNLATGEIMVRRGKGGKMRVVFVGQKARKSLRALIRVRTSGAVFLTRCNERLNISGLRAILKRRAALAGVSAPTLHSFRRAFALNCLRAGMDVFSLQRLLGHSDLSVLRRYLAQTTGDLSIAHRKASPVDNMPSSAEVLFSRVGALAGVGSG